MVHEKRNRRTRLDFFPLPLLPDLSFFVLAVFRSKCFRLLTPFLLKLLVELDEKQRLVLHVCEEVMLPDEVKDIRPPQAQCVRERLAWLAVSKVPAVDRTFSSLVIA